LAHRREGGRYAEALIKLETILAKERKYAGVKIEGDDLSPNSGEGEKGEVSDIVANELGVSARTLDSFKYVFEHAPALNDQISADTMAIDEAYKIAKKVADIEVCLFPQGRGKVRQKKNKRTDYDLPLALQEGYTDEVANLLLGTGLGRCQTVDPESYLRNNFIYI
jgi:hypothetical protein